MSATERADVCLIGLGAAGCIAAAVLAEAGLRVVALEAGPRRERDEFRRDEIADAIYQRAGLGPKFNREVPTWREHEDAPTQPATFSLGRMNNGLGGSTLHYAAWLRRYQPGDFVARTHTLARYGEAALPADASFVDWPFGYDELEPYYSRVEHAMGVAGLPGNVEGRPVDGGNPFEGYRSRPFPLPPLRPAGLGQLFAEAARAAGYHPYSPPVGINSAPFDGRPACSYCGVCTGYGCYRDAKSSANLVFLPRALATGNLEIKTAARAVRITTDADGAASGVDYVDAEGLQQHQPAAIVVLAAYTFESVRLLLLSTSERYPRGLANGHDQVGRHFTTKQYPHIFGLLEGRRVNRYSGPAAQSVLMDDFLGDNFDHTGLGFIRGATLSLEFEQLPIGAAKEVLPPNVPRWGSGYKQWLLNNWNSVVPMEIQPEAMMTTGNRLDLDSRVRDTSGLGLPVVRITYRQHPNELALIAYMQPRCEDLLRAMGCTVVWRGPTFTGVGSSHDVGGLRMGASAIDSVVDSDQRAHEVDNLYVLGGSVLPTCPGINPTLTIQALAWRASERLAAEWRRGRGL
jgi:gluconate 2-dehydrogenase alpha chain